jgi:rare lipoprotein A (peptidoglycan hydrolase)
MRRSQTYFSVKSSPYRLSLTLIFFLLVACSSTPPPSKQKGNSYAVYGKRYYPLSSSAGFTQRGLASWYGRHRRP